VWDGDSVHVVADLGFDLTIKLMVRLNGINARELSEPGGPEARDHLAGLIPPGSAVTLTSVAVDKFGGRTDGVLTTPAGVNVSAQMVKDGYAAAWNGEGPRPSPPWPIPAS